MPNLLPFLHPTTVMVVDDDPQFLASFEYRYGRIMRMASATSPEAALSTIAANQAEWSTRYERLVAYHRSLTQGADPAYGLGALALAEAEQRQSTFSVVIVDYAMPGMTGVEFCRKISALPLRKILLTGMTGNDTAVAAFNEGLIDCFLVKQDTALSEKIPREVARLKEVFFREAASPLGLTAVGGRGGVLLDPAISARMRELLQRVNAVEHYIIFPEAGVGILMADITGKTTVAILFDDDCMRAQIEAAEEENAPAELVAALRSRSAIGYFPNRLGFFTSEFAQTWRDFVAPAQLINGENAMWLAVMPGKSFGTSTPAVLGPTMYGRGLQPQA